MLCCFWYAYTLTGRGVASLAASAEELLVIHGLLMTSAKRAKEGKAFDG